MGLLNEGMRFRDLETGVFLTRDPIGYGDGPNVYCYVHCNPITHFDALGLEDNSDDYYSDDLSDDQQIIKDSIDQLTWTTDDDGNQVTTDYANTDLGAEIIDNLHKMNSQGRISFSAAPGGKKHPNASGAYKAKGEFSDNKSTIEIADKIKNDPVERAAFLSHEGMHAIQDKYGNAVSQNTGAEKEAFIAEQFARETVSNAGFTRKSTLGRWFDRRAKQNRYSYAEQFIFTPGISDFAKGYAGAWASENRAKAQPAYDAALKKLEKRNTTKNAIKKMRGTPEQVKLDRYTVSNWYKK